MRLKAINRLLLDREVTRCEAHFRDGDLMAKPQRFQGDAAQKHGARGLYRHRVRRKTRISSEGLELTDWRSSDSVENIDGGGSGCTRENGMLYRYYKASK